MTTSHKRVNCLKWAQQGTITLKIDALVLDVYGLMLLANGGNGSA